MAAKKKASTPKSNPLVDSAKAVAKVNSLLKISDAETICRVLKIIPSGYKKMMAGGKIRRATEKNILALTPAALQGLEPVKREKSTSGNSCGICKLKDVKQREQIDTLLGKGSVSIRGIARQVFNDEGKQHSIGRHAACIGLEVDVVRTKKNKKSALHYADEQAKSFERFRKLFAAVEEFVTDPDDEEKYSLARHDSEIEVIWDKPQLNGNGKKANGNGKIKTKRVKETLSDIADYLLGQGVSIARFKVHPASRAVLLLEALKKFEPYLRQLGESAGAFKAAAINPDDIAPRAKWTRSLIAALVMFYWQRYGVQASALEIFEFILEHNPDSQVAKYLVAAEQTQITNIQPATPEAKAALSPIINTTAVEIVQTGENKEIPEIQAS